MTDKDIMKLIDEAQQLGAARGWDMREKLVYLVERAAKAATDAALKRAAEEVKQLDKKHWFSKQSKFAEFLVDAILALKDTK